MRISVLSALLCTSTFVSSQQLLAADPVPSQGAAKNVIVGVPTGPSPNGIAFYSIRVYYTDATTGKTVFKDISVGGIAAAPANATAAQASAASAAKMKAIVAAINAAAIPIKPVDIGGTSYATVTASANMGTVAGMYNTGKTEVKIINGVATTVPILAPADMSTYTVNGVTQTVINPGTKKASLSSGVFRTPGNTTTGGDR